MNERMTETADSPLCGDPARYDRGECNWPKCGCKIKDDAPAQTAIPPDWTTERRLRSAVVILQGTCDAVLRLVPLDDRLRTAIAEALEYSQECQKP